MTIATVTISIDIANQISVYLGRRPYDEVSPFIEMFRTEARKSIDEQETSAKGAEATT